MDSLDRIEKKTGETQRNISVSVKTQQFGQRFTCIFNLLKRNICEKTHATQVLNIYFFNTVTFSLAPFISCSIVSIVTSILTKMQSG